EKREEQRAEGRVDGMFHDSVVIVVTRGGVIALLPPRALHPPGAQRDEEGREPEQRQADQIRREHRHVASDDDAILEKVGWHLRFWGDAQEVLSRGHPR